MSRALSAVQSKLLLSIVGVVHGFGTKSEPIPASLLTKWNEQKPSWKQVHGAAAIEVMSGGQSCGEADAIWTRQKDIPIAVVTADCVPILLARKDGLAAAAVHAGWRGTRAHILSALWEKLKAQGEKPAEWIASVGPAIGPCCYEVSEEIADDFQREFAMYGKDLAVPRHRILDLPAINAQELRQIGLKEVDMLRYCTRCDEGFHSYRREGGGTRQYSMMMLKA
jgi:YfiH family protein